MIKKYLGITLISASLAFAGCSSNDDDDGGDIDQTTDAGAGAGDQTGDQTGDGETGAPDGGPVDPAPAPAPSGEVVVPMEFDPGPDVAESITEALTTAGNFTVLLGAVDASGLGGALADGSIRTVFAPNDAALQPLVDSGQIPTDQELLQGIVLGHTIDGALDGNLVAASVGQTVTTANGNSLAITQDGDQLLIAGVPIIATDLNTATGIIHTIDGVIGITGADAAPAPVEGEGEGDAAPAPVGGGDGEVGEGETDLGASLNNLSSAGFTDYVTVHNASGLGTVYDDNGWTAFIPDNDSIPDAALTADEAAAFAILNNHIITTGVIAFADLAGLGATTTNSGLAVTFGGTAGAPTINGFAITEIQSPGNAALYSINGLLQ